MVVGLVVEGEGGGGGGYIMCAQRTHRPVCLYLRLDVCLCLCLCPSATSDSLRQVRRPEAGLQVQQSRSSVQR